MRHALMLAAVGALLSAAAWAQDAPPGHGDVYPVAPDDGAVLGSRPVFAIGFDDVPDADVRRLRFRIVLEPEDGDPRVYDQRRRRSGWGPGEAGEVLFRPPRPLVDGRYTWRAAVWNGVDWTEASAPRTLRIDTVAPAWVGTLRVVFEEGNRVHLEWDPVTVDLDGGPEFVTRYHVFRFEVGPSQPMARPFEIAVVETPEYVDDSAPLDRAIVYYRVAAEDQAGNVTGQRR